MLSTSSNHSLLYFPIENSAMFPGEIAGCLSCVLGMSFELFAWDFFLEKLPHIGVAEELTKVEALDELVLIAELGRSSVRLVLLQEPCKDH